MKLDEILELNSMDKAQLVQLCNALYELLQARTVQAPQFVFPVNPPIPYQPYVNPFASPQFHGGTTVCAHNSESTQQERFGVK